MKDTSNSKYNADVEVAELMRAVDRRDATGHFAWIGSDGWSARELVTQGWYSLLSSPKDVTCYPR